MSVTLTTMLTKEWHTFIAIGGIAGAELTIASITKVLIVVITIIEVVVS